MHTFTIYVFKRTTQYTIDILTGNTTYKPIDGSVEPYLQYLYNTQNKGNIDACNVSYTATDNLLQQQMLKTPPDTLKDISAKHRYNAHVSETICGDSSGCEWVSFIDGIVSDNSNTNGICVTK